MLFFTKAKRAQSDTDFETWTWGGVVPTLNRMDNNGEAFATVLIIDGTRVNDVRVYEDGIVPTVISRYGTGGGNVPMVFPIQDGREVEKHQNGLGVGNENDPAYTVDTVSRQAVVMRDREGKPGGGKGPLISETAFTLATSNFHTLFPDPSTVRRLTPKECERLQGFPDDWTEGQADSSRYKQMGNAVAVPVVEWIVNRLVLSTSPSE
jgi:DNA (cytosine-5)-methyltransferase 1